MKKLIIPIIFILNITKVLMASNQFILKGKAADISTGKAVLSYSVFIVDRFKQIKDTAIISQGNFLFRGNLKEPAKAVLEIGDKELSIFIEPTSMELSQRSDDLSKFSLKGSKTQDDAESFKRCTQELDKLDDEISDRFKKIYFQLDTMKEVNPAYKKLAEEKESVSLQMISVRNLGNKKVVDFIRLNPNSFFSLINNNIGNLLSNGYLPVDSARILFDNLSEEVRLSTFGTRTNIAIKAKENVMIGKMAPDFNTLDRSGKMVKLSDFRGRSYILLDFWASWCAPCIKGIPHLKQLFTKYHMQGLELICISSDNEKAKWLSAIEKHNLSSWHHLLSVQDLLKSSKGIENKEDISKKYPVGDGVPQYMIIDKTGKVIGRWVGYSEQNENEMDQIFKELFQ